MAELKTSHKIILAMVLACVLLVGAVVSLVIVLAAANQNVNSSISVSYIVDGVGAKASAKYAVVSRDNAVAVSKVSMTSGNATEIEFGVSETETTKSLVPAGEIVLGSMSPKVVFEYAFTNTTEGAFTVALSDLETTATVENINIGYHVSSRELLASEFRNDFLTTAFETQAVVERGKTMYVYLSFEVADLTRSARFEGKIEWTLANSQTLDLVLNNAGGTGNASMKAIAGANMPLVYDLPTLSGKSFGGYYVGDVQYIDANGMGVRACDLENGATLTAFWTENTAVVENGTLVKLTALGEESSAITIPSGVQSIGEGAFENNAGLESVSFEGAEALAYAGGDVVLERICADAFKNCANLKTVRIPGTVKIIDGPVLAGCNAIETLEFPYVLGEGTIESNGLCKLFGTVRDDTPQTLKNIVVNGGSIAGLGFYYAHYIENVTIKNVDVIGNDAFNMCVRMETLTLTEGLKKIEWSAFPNTKLTELIIPSTVTKVNDGYVIAASSRLSRIVVAEGNPVYNSGDGANCVIETATNTLIMGCKGTVIPNTVTKIGPNAFAYARFATIEIPASVKEIGNSAFASCDALSMITIPATIEKIGNNVFSDCTALTHVRNFSGQPITGWAKQDYAEEKTDNSEFSSSIEIRGNYVILTQSNGTKGILAYLDNQDEIIDDMPSDVTTIHVEAFNGFRYLKEVVIPESITTIGVGAFNSWGNANSSIIFKVHSPITMWYDSSFNLPVKKILYINNQTLLSGLTSSSAKAYLLSGASKLYINSAHTVSDYILANFETTGATVVDGGVTYTLYTKKAA